MYSTKKVNTFVHYAYSIEEGEIVQSQNADEDNVFDLMPNSSTKNAVNETDG